MIIEITYYNTKFVGKKNFGALQEMRDHSPLKYVTVDVNLCNFCHKLDVYSVNFMVTFQILSPPST